MRFLLAGLGIVIAASLLRIYHIGQQELWLDEALSFHLASARDWLGAMLGDSNPPLYYILLRGWISLAGTSETALRLPSAIAGILFVVLVIRAGQEFFNPSAGLWSGLFAAVAPMHIYYSQEARSYALLLLALLSAYVTLWQALKKNSGPSWLLFLLCSVIAIYSHYFAVLGLLSTIFLVLLFSDKRDAKQIWLRYGGALFLTGLLLLPWLMASFVLREHSLTQVSWIDELWNRASPFLQIPRSLEVLGLGSQSGLSLLQFKQFGSIDFPSTLRFLGISVLLLLGINLGLPWGEKRLGIPHLTKRKICFALLLLVPVLTLWLVSFYKPFYVVGRYDMLGFTAYTLLIGLSFAKIQSAGRSGPMLSLMIALAILTPIGVKLTLYYRAPAPTQSQKTARFLDAVVNNGDLVLFTGFRAPLVLYYLHNLGYRCDEGACSRNGGQKIFSCLVAASPSRAPFAPHALHAMNLKETVWPEFMNSLKETRERNGSVWVIPYTLRYSENKIFLTKIDLFLAKTLGQSGFATTPAESFGVLLFRSR